MRSSTRSTVFLAVFAAAVLTGATVMAAPITLPVSRCSSSTSIMNSSVSAIHPQQHTPARTEGQLGHSPIRVSRHASPASSDIRVAQLAYSPMEDPRPSNTGIL